MDEKAFEVQQISDGEESDEGMDMPDQDLLQMQKQRSIPPICLCEVAEDSD